MTIYFEKGRWKEGKTLGRREGQGGEKKKDENNDIFLTPEFNVAFLHLARHGSLNIVFFKKMSKSFQSLVLYQYPVLITKNFTSATDFLLSTPHFLSPLLLHSFCPPVSVS